MLRGYRAHITSQVLGYEDAEGPDEMLFPEHAGEDVKSFASFPIDVGVGQAPIRWIPNLYSYSQHSFDMLESKRHDRVTQKMLTSWKTFAREILMIGGELNFFSSKSSEAD